MSAVKLAYPCSRCEGHGKIRAFSHVLGGVCLKCGGTGNQTKKPIVRSPLFAVFLQNSETGKLDRIWNVRTRSSAEARRESERLYFNASAGFKDIYSLDRAVIVRADELDESADPVIHLEAGRAALTECK